MGKPYNPKDHYFRRAKDVGLRARSAFKIEEIARRFGILKRGARVLDLGAAPGGFLQVIADEIGAAGAVVGVDLVRIRPIPKTQVSTLVLDVLADDFDERLGSAFPGSFDAIVSDMAPKTSGIRATDEARSLCLARRALEIARTRGSPGSHFVVKLFMGGDFEEFRQQVRSEYEEVKIVRPRATRGASAEIYVVGLRRKAGQTSSGGDS